MLRPRGREIFSTAHVNPWINSELMKLPCATNGSIKTAYKEENNDEEETGEIYIALLKLEVADQTGGPRKVKVKRGSVEERESSESRMDELNGLLNDGTLEAIPESSIKGIPRILNSRFV